MSEKRGKISNFPHNIRSSRCILNFSVVRSDQMEISFILMDSKLQELSNDTKNTKFGVRTKKLCKFQSMKMFIVA